MKHILLAIPDNKYQFFLELIENLSFVEVEDDEEEIAMEELQNSLHQVKLMQEGKIPKQTAEDFINEL